MKEYFRGIVWPREMVEEEGKRNYRYVVVGMLVTNEPLAKFEGKNEVALTGSAVGMADALTLVKEGKLKCKLGDATGVLLGLRHAFKE